MSAEPTKETNVRAPEPPQQADFLTGLFGSPEKLFEYLTYVLIVFLLLSIIILFTVEKQ